MMKDYMVDDIFLGALFYPGSSSNAIFLLKKKIKCISCLGFILTSQLIKICMSGHKDEFY